MEIVIVEKKTFEALLAAAGTLAAKVDALQRRCGDRQGCKWLDGEDVCRILRISPRTLRIMRDNCYLQHPNGCFFAKLIPCFIQRFDSSSVVLV